MNAGGFEKVGKLVDAGYDESRDVRTKAIVTLGENLLKVIILVGSMIYMDPRFSMLVLIFMPFAWFMLSRQRRKIPIVTTANLS